MKKYLLAFGFVLFSLVNVVFAQQAEDTPIDQQTLSELDVPAGTQDVDFDGILPRARKSCSPAEAASGICIDKNGDGYDDAYAAEKSAELGRKIENGTIGLSDIPIFIVKAIDLFTKLAGSITVLMLMWAGVQYMFGELSGEKEKAKTTIQYALIGLVVTFLSWLAVNIVKTQLTGVDYYGNFVEEQQ